MFLPAIALAGDIRAGLVSYWPLNVDSGGTTPDASGVNTMTISGGSTIVAGQYGDAFSFNGTSQYVSLTHSTDNGLTGLPIYASTNGYTICFWVKAPAVGSGNSTDRYLFTEGNTTANNPLLLLQTRNSGRPIAANDKLDVSIRNDGGGNRINHITSAQVVFDNNWHHVAWTDYRGLTRLYVDGNPDSAFTNYTWAPTGVTLNSTAVGALVRASVGGFFNGAVDDVALWQRALTQAEVNQVRTSGLTIPSVPEIAQQPAGSTNQMGDRIMLSAWGVGAPAVTYQWRKDDVDLTGSTAYYLVLTNLTAASSNVYSVVAANGNGSVTSSYAPVVVLADAAPDPRAGLVSFWPMDVVNYTVSNTNTPDVYYGHTDLVLSNMDQSYLVTGQFSNGLAFNQGASSTQYGKRSGGSPIYNVTNYTVSLWVRGFDQQQNKQVFAEGGTGGDFWLFGTENAAPYAGLLSVKVTSATAGNSLPDRKSTQTVFDNTWHHIVWVDENGKAQLYVDGVVDATDFTYTRINLNLQSTAIGALYRSSPANYFLGDVDEVCMWNRRLSLTEIQQVRDSGVPAANVVAPQITQPPVGSTNHLGERIAFTVQASGTLPLVYQWYRDGSPVSGATDTSLPLYLITPTTNTYAVIVTNLAGPATGGPVSLVVFADATPDVRAGLWHYWSLDSVSDFAPTNSPDLYSGDPMVLVNMDGSSLAAGQFGNALAFDGVTNYCARSGGFPIYLTTNYSVSMWVKGDGAVNADKRVFSEGSTSANLPLFTIACDPAGASASAAIYLRNSQGATLLNSRKSTRAVFDNAWHHILWVDENGKGKLYVDGVLDETDFSYSRTGTFTLNTTGLGTILRAAQERFFNGLIDEVALWNRRVSYTEIGQIYGNALPASTGPIAPAIFTDPVDHTNNAWATDAINLSVVASGTDPLAYQWWKDGAPLPTSVNPGATNSTLAFTNLQTGDAGSYWVVVTNLAGAATSRVAQVTVIPYVPVTSGDALKLDFEAAASSNLQPGFTREAIPLSGTNFGGVVVTLSTIADAGGTVTLADRDRVALGGGIADNPPLLTQSALYNDFIYVSQSTYPDGNGIRIRIERLAHNTPFGVTIWSWDSQSAGGRHSDWIETSSGSTLVITNGYVFDSSVLPAHDYDWTFGALLTSTASGVLQIEGRKNGGSTGGNSAAVFVNAIRLVANPVIRITNAQVLGGNLRLSIEAQYPYQALSLLERSNLGAGTWSPATGILAAEMHGNIATVDLTLSAGPVFYRVSSP